MVTIKSKKEIEYMREACRATALVHKRVEEAIKPGVTTAYLDKVAEEVIKELGGIPAQKGYPSGVRGVMAFPSTLCISINDEIIHGIPSNKVYIKDGDVVSIDLVVYKDGFNGDAARTFIVGKPKSKEDERLVEITKQAFFEGIKYAKKGNKLVQVIRITAETLSGIPSIVYGLFGMLFFVNTLKWGFSVLAGAFTLSIMILPLIMRQTEEALKAVPDSYREGSFGLGAGKLRTVFRIVLPSAVPGILAGVILAIGRIVGETAALIYTAGTVAQVPKNVLGSGRTLAIHMYMLSSEGLYMNQAYATAVILLILVVVINTLSGMIAKRLTKK